MVKLGGNELSSLPEGLFAKQIFLEELHLDRNKFVGVPNDAMKYLYHLSVLNMSGNLINRLSENSFDYVGSLQVSWKFSPVLLWQFKKKIFYSLDFQD